MPLAHASASALAPALAPAPPGMPGPPDPPRYDLWPTALRSAGRLHGALVPCGPGVRGVGWPETPRVRATALAEFIGEDRVATHLTAAWVWGAARDPGRPLRASVPAKRRYTGIDTEMLRVSELRLSESDVTPLGRFAVTTPLRTVLDLLHDPDGFGPVERIACRLLVHRIGGWAAVAARIEAHRRPYRTAALRRLGRPTGEGQRSVAPVSMEPRHVRPLVHGTASAPSSTRAVQ